MKKRILYYIGWDVSIGIFIYLYYLFGLWLQAYKIKNLSFTSLIIVKPFLLIPIGVLFALLMFMSNKYQVSRKQAVLEFILIGIPSLYLTTILEMSYFVYLVLGLNIPFYSPANRWLYTNSVSTVVGGIIFGYELVVLIKRLRSCSKQNPSETT